MKICPVCSREYGHDERVCPRDGVALVNLDTGADDRGDNLIGEVVAGRYRIERIVGRGGMGTVYACRHVLVGKAFAMKVLRSGVERSTEVMQRFIREAQAANAIRSRHICEMVDFGQLESGAFYVVMELLEGPSLTRALRDRALDSAGLRRVFIQIAEALDRAHQAGIVHRDLKPDNVILVEDEGNPFFVKLVDFGIAKMMQADASHLTETGIILGTPYYMSPEQARGDAVDHRSDIYALGVMMYRAFTGKLPFVADTAMGVLTRHLVQQPELPSRIAEIDPVIERVILRCMEKQPIDRFQTMADVAAAIGQAGTEPGLPRGHATIDDRGSAAMRAALDVGLAGATGSARLASTAATRVDGPLLGAAAASAGYAAAGWPPAATAGTSLAYAVPPPIQSVPPAAADSGSRPAIGAVSGTYTPAGMGGQPTPTPWSATGPSRPLPLQAPLSPGLTPASPSYPGMPLPGSTGPQPLGGADPQLGYGVPPLGASQPGAWGASSPTSHVPVGPPSLGADGMPRDFVMDAATARGLVSTRLDTRGRTTTGRVNVLWIIGALAMASVGGAAALYAFHTPKASPDAAAGSATAVPSDPSETPTSPPATAPGTAAVPEPSESPSSEATAPTSSAAPTATSTTTRPPGTLPTATAPRTSTSTTPFTKPTSEIRSPFD